MTEHAQTRQGPDWILGLNWLMATVAATSLGTLIVTLMTDPSDAFSASALMALVGAFVGLLQWLVLGRVLRITAWWIPATVLSWPIPLVAVVLIVGLTQRYDAELLVALCARMFAGLAMAWAQWLVLRSKVKDAGRWIPVAALAHVVSYVAAGLLFAQDGEGPGFDIANGLSWGESVPGGLAETCRALADGLITGVTLSILAGRTPSRSTVSRRMTALLACASILGLVAAVLLAALSAGEPSSRILLDIQHRAGRTDFSGLEWSQADLHALDLCLVNLSWVTLPEADLTSVNLDRADLSYADLTAADLTDANLSSADLREANLSNAAIRGADMSYAHLQNANLSGANLEGADLSGANLSHSTLHGALMAGADLRGANLTGANLEDADLSGVNLESVIGTRLQQLDRAQSLQGATMPDGTIHE